MHNPTPLSDSPQPAVQLWLGYPADLLDASVCAACTHVLSETERQRASRFRFERHRREYLATHALARTALACNHPLEPADWRFQQNAHGKPAADPDCGLRFNLSNALELVVCLVARGAEVGVDVEPHRRADEILPLAPRVFSSAEQEQLEALPAGERPARALSLWVLKESYIKARGLGLSLPLRKFSFLFDGAQGIRLAIDPSLNDQPARWHFRLLDRAAHRIALMVDRTACAPAARERQLADSFRLEILEARPPFAPGARLPAADGEWFPRLHAHEG